jgi:hypothetical protein
MSAGLTVHLIGTMDKTKRMLLIASLAFAITSILKLVFIETNN